MTDPIITAIEQFRAGLAMFNVIPSEVTEQMEDQLIAATYGPPTKVLLEWDQPAQTFEGAVEALRLAKDEISDFSGSVIAENMVKAALPFFEELQEQVQADLAVRNAA